MKQYEEPMMDVVLLEAEDVITLSVDDENKDLNDEIDFGEW